MLRTNQFSTSRYLCSTQLAASSPLPTADPPHSILSLIAIPCLSLYTCHQSPPTSAYLSISYHPTPISRETPRTEAASPTNISLHCRAPPTSNPELFLPESPRLRPRRQRLNGAQDLGSKHVKEPGTKYTGRKNCSAERKQIIRRGITDLTRRSGRRMWRKSRRFREPPRDEASDSMRV